MSALSFIIAILATYRLAHMMTREDGPFDVFANLRGAMDPEQKTWWGRGLNCALCVSFWLALPAALMAGGGAGEWIGVAGGALIVHKAFYP